MATAKAVEKKRKAAQQRILDAVNKEFGEGSAVRLSDGFRGDVVDALPMGIDVVDKFICGCGGLPIGRMTELFSAEGGGKSSLTLAALGSAQRTGATTVLVETENGFTRNRAIQLGCNPDDLIIVQPNYLEQALSQLEYILDSLDPAMGPSLVAFDSLAAAPTKQEMEDGVKDKGYFDSRAKTVSQSMRILTQKVSTQRANLLIVNQTRQKIGVVFGDPTTTPGGTALKFHASLRLAILGGKALKDAAGNHTGKDLTIVAKKTRFSEPFRSCRLRLNYGTGFDNDWSTLNLAKDWKLIPPRSRNIADAIAALDAVQWDPNNLEKIKDAKARLKE